MAKLYPYNSPTHQNYKLIVSYRFFLAFMIGYLTWVWCNISLAYGFYYIGLDKAESVFLAAFCTAILACIWVLLVFCIQSILKISAICLSCLIFFAIIHFGVIG